MDRRVLLSVLLVITLMLIPGAALAQGGGGGGATPDRAITLDVQLNSDNLQPIEQTLVQVCGWGRG